LYLTNSTRVAASAAAVVVLAAVLVGTAPAAAAQDADPQSLDAARIDVAAISFDGTAMGLAADDTDGQPHDPASLVYTTELDQDGVEVGWDTSGIGAGAVFGDAVTLGLRAADGPATVQTDPLRVPVGERGGVTWTFPAPGRYTLVLTVEAHLLTGEPVSTEERYTVDVQGKAADAPPPEPARAAPLADPLPAAPLAAQPPTTTPGSVVLSEGHVDAVAPRLLDGKLQLQVKDGTTVGQPGGEVRWREPANVAFHVKPESRTALPDDPALAFLGKKGDEVFLLPQQQQAGLLWTGWSTEELHADQVSGAVTLRLTEVDGPGAFGIFTTGSFGDSTVVFDSTDGLPDSHQVALGTHAHANWAFAKPGVYRLTFDVSARLADGRTVSDRENYTFTVGDSEPGNAPPGGTGGGADSAGPGLAYTGTGGVLPLAAGGVVLVGLGGVVVLAGSRRQKAEKR
jgi:surface-anchored protein